MESCRRGDHNQIRLVLTEGAIDIPIGWALILLHKGLAPLRLRVYSGNKVKTRMMAKGTGMGVDMHSRIKVQVIAHTDLTKAHDQDTKTHVSPLRRTD